MKLRGAEDMRQAELANQDMRQAELANQDMRQAELANQDMRQAELANWGISGSPESPALPGVNML